MAVERIHAREILDSRGNPTVEVDLYTQKGTWMRTRDGGEPAGLSVCTGSCHLLSHKSRTVAGA
uniref:Enolase N-terminal domain-containing protein n=1 Tax=Strix occidentalis caurina TaxID=311401 RepID=A0A8D0ESP3_STROC